MTIGLLEAWEATGGPPPGDLSSWGTDAFTQGQHFPGAMTTPSAWSVKMSVCLQYSVRLHSRRVVQGKQVRRMSHSAGVYLAISRHGTAKPA